MLYCKPEIQPLGSASSVVQGSLLKTGCCFDNTSDLASIPTYEADE